MAAPFLSTQHAAARSVRQCFSSAGSSLALSWSRASSHLRSPRSLATSCCRLSIVDAGSADLPSPSPMLSPLPAEFRCGLSRLRSASLPGGLWAPRCSPLCRTWHLHLGALALPFPLALLVSLLLLPVPLVLFFIREQSAGLPWLPAPSPLPSRRLQLLMDDTLGGPAQVLSFYVYRAGPAQAGFPLENCNAADLPGVMWYLHNEVVGTTPRKFLIDRVRRHRVWMLAADAEEDLAAAGSPSSSSTASSFGPFVAFDSGRCTAVRCGDTLRSSRYRMGCQVLNSSRNAYFSPFVTHRSGGSSCPPSCSDGLWFSLPGACPTRNFTSKDQRCEAEAPGGRCLRLADVGSRGAACRFYSEEAGEVLLDDLIGVKDYRHWWAVDHSREYDWKTDRGVGTDFWDLRHDAARCRARMDRVQHMFRERYPEMPVTFGSPICDS